jgi:hypothetical protein
MEEETTLAALLFVLQEMGVKIYHPQKQKNDLGFRISDKKTAPGDLKEEIKSLLMIFPVPDPPKEEKEAPKENVATPPKEKEQPKEKTKEKKNEKPKQPMKTGLVKISDICWEESTQQPGGDFLGGVQLIVRSGILLILMEILILIEDYDQIVFKQDKK